MLLGPLRLLARPAVCYFTARSPARRKARLMLARTFARGLIALRPRRRMRREDRLIARFDHARRALKF